MTSSEPSGSEESPSFVTPVHHRLLCISAAFELLSGQGTLVVFSPLQNQNMIASFEWPGEALNVDLSGFVNHLYAILPSIGISNEAGDTGGDILAKVRHKESEKPMDTASDWSSQAQMLFHVLHLIFFRNAGGVPPAWRAAAFSKRLLTAALHWESAAAVQAVQFVGGLMRRIPKLEALLTTEDRSFDGVYQAEMDDPQLCNPFGTSLFELMLLGENHVDPVVRDAASTLASSSSR